MRLSQDETHKGSDTVEIKEKVTEACIEDTTQPKGKPVNEVLLQEISVIACFEDPGF